MKVYQKPDLKVFAENAKPDEIQDFPDVQRGWGITIEQTKSIPPIEWFNALGNRADLQVNYLLQNGVAQWYDAMTYPKGAVTNLDGVLYVAAKESAGKRPNVSPDSWTLLINIATPEDITAGTQGKLVDAAGLQTFQPMGCAQVGDIKQKLSLIEDAGWLIFDDKDHSKEKHKDLYAMIEPFCRGGSTPDFFKLPKLGGQFPRVLDLEGGVDTGRELGSFQGDMIKAHTHTAPRFRTVGGGGSNLAVYDADGPINIQTGSFGGSETRGKNFALAYFIYSGVAV